MFVGRQVEMAALDAFFHDDRSNLAVVLGRRRVGKSTMIAEALRRSGVKYMYFTCLRAQAVDNLRMLVRELEEHFRLPRHVRENPDFKEILDEIFTLARDETFVLVLDEYPYLRKELPGCDSLLQMCLDRFKHNSKLKIVLCGSYIGVMREMLQEAYPLYGRAKPTIHLKPMDYYDAAQFWPGFSNEDKIRLYAVTGGTPFYCAFVNPTLSFKENVIDLALSPVGRLAEELENVVAMEIGRIVHANSILSALCAKPLKNQDLIAQSKLTPSVMQYVSDRLIEIALVEKVAPINEPNNPKKTFYGIADPLAQFMYTFVRPNINQLRSGDLGAMWDELIARRFEEHYVPKIFERVAKEFLIRRNRAGRISPMFQLVGTYSYNDPRTRQNGQFDVVTKGADGYACWEVKFRNHSMTRAEMWEEIEQVKRSPLDCSRFGFISKAGFRERPDDPNITCYDLNDLFDF